MAFLYAYEGNLDKAYGHYMSAFRSRLPNVKYPQIEIFINEIIESKPEKYQLHYCLGLVNYYAKEDYILAREELSQFIKQSTEGKYTRQVASAKDMIAAIDKQILPEPEKK